MIQTNRIQTHDYIIVLQESLIYLLRREDRTINNYSCNEQWPVSNQILKTVFLVHLKFKKNNL